MIKQIGILGGNGAIGSRLTELLSEHKDIQIKVSVRTENLINLEHHQIKYETLNLDSVDALKRFINGCDIVVNCTGYYNKNIIECCSECCAHYVDTSGELNLAQSEGKLDKQLQQKRLSAVQFVGVNSGLTEVLIVYCKAYLNVDELELYFSGSGELSNSAVLEIIETSEPPYSYSQIKHDTEQSLLNQKFDLYKKNVNKAVEDIKDKLYSKVILSRKIIISERINMLHSYFLGLKINNPARSYLYDINGMELFGFSPETIVQVDNNNKVFTFPLAGTRKNKEHLKKELLTDIKEVGEHAVSVKLAVEELKNVCKSDTIKIEEFMNIYERGSVQHLGSVQKYTTVLTEDQKV
ncbi:chorismate-binding protein [Staphylococcus coagulans]|uniref:Chorismate-binding protein n=1 Tax=Staphylococcus coagulans TaxID=74706 RepID=A0A9X0PI93_9STAP|nr:chorismate-binding protein [Staphylococcus coagulans]MBA8771967.1 chorismate-binding protein [Staphylococcus coagulans]MBA8777513.1 chorismate-binding protein [Staphylococcus coagulans]